MQSGGGAPAPAAVRVELHRVADDPLLHLEPVRLRALDAERECGACELEGLHILLTNLQGKCDTKPSVEAQRQYLKLSGKQHLGLANGACIGALAAYPNMSCEL